MFRLFPVMRTGRKSLAINFTSSLLFFQLFIFIMTDTRWINYAQFIENKGDCLLFLHNEKHPWGGLQRPPGPQLQNYTRLHYHWKLNLIIKKRRGLKVLRIYTGVL